MVVSIDLTAYGFTFAFIAIEVLYGAWLLSNPSPQIKAKGFVTIYDAFESAVLGLILAAILLSSQIILSAFGIFSVSPAEAEQLCLQTRDRYTTYVMDLANVARDITLTGILAPLAATWHAACSLANFFATYLMTVSTALLVASRLCSIYGSPLASLGIVLTGISRFKRVGPTLAISIVTLQVYVGVAAPYLNSAAAELRFKYIGIPIAGIAQYFAGAVEEVINDAKAMGDCVAWFTLSTTVAAALSIGAVTAAGGLPESLIARLRV
ncbi:MAG: hypothetical protein QXY49_01740 [Thermofilaceae archaeon]